MLLYIFGAILAAASLGFGVIWLLEQRNVWKDEILEGVTGVKDWRKRLDTTTERFVALGAEPMLARAASQSDDPVKAKLNGQTLNLYVRVKALYLALSYAYNCGSRAVQQTEAMFRIQGPLKLVTIRNAGELAEQGLEIKEIKPEFYRSILQPGRYDPQGPVYHLEYLFNVCDKLVDEILRDIKSIKDCPAQITARLTQADGNLAKVKAQYEALLAAQVKYLPYDERLAAIAQKRASISGAITCDPLGALAYCAELDKAIAALAKELGEASTLLTTVNKGEEQLAASRAYVTKVRATQVTCPWSDYPDQPAYWTLSNPDSDPDNQLAQSETLFQQARQALANGQLQTVPGETTQALAARAQADKMVKAQFDAKTAVDEKVPLVRAEITTIRAQQIRITGGDSTHEMAKLVERTCSAVEGRIGEVRNLYEKQRFPEALTLLNGTAGNEYGMPVAQLLQQARELLKLLEHAAQVASTLAAQPA
jgi:hypothetical protein